MPYPDEDGQPCPACPWTSKEQRDLDAIRDMGVQPAMEAGQWFCCHVNMGTCHGARLRYIRHLKDQARGDQVEA